MVFQLGQHKARVHDKRQPLTVLQAIANNRKLLVIGVILTSCACTIAGDAIVIAAVSSRTSVILCTTVIVSNNTYHQARRSRNLLWRVVISVLHWASLYVLAEISC